MDTNNRVSPDPVRKGSTVKDWDLDENMLHDAIENHQFALYYQPQIDLPSGKVIGFEGLLRWRHPDLGMKLPETFIPVAEQTGQIQQLTDLVINTGFRFIEKLGPGISFSLNISTQCIKDGHLVAILDRVCREFHIDPYRVVLEFTEMAPLEDAGHTEYILTQLKNHGFRLGIDDAGTGYSSMPQLARLPFSELKIDKSLVATMALSSESRQSIHSTIALASSLGITTIAEGIENGLEAIGLRELGCQFGQGYYFAQPMDEADTLKWLENWNKNLSNPM